MAAFTTTIDSIQNLSILNELITSYSEHRQCVGDSSVAAITAGHNIQDVTFWTAMQNWTLNNYQHFIDDDSFSTSTAYTDETSPAYTLSTFYAAAIPSGFRRATTWPTDWTDYGDAAYSYGVMQVGDIVGPWLIIDLQRAFETLKWTYRAVKFAYVAPDYELVSIGGQTNVSCSISSDLLYAGNYNDTSGVAPPDWENMYDQAVLDWTDYSGTADAAPYVYGVRESFTYDSLGLQTCGISFRSRELQFSSIPTHLPHSADAYYFIEGNDTFEDFQSLGIADSKFYLKQAFTSASSSTRSVDKYASAITPYYKAPTLSSGQQVAYGAKSEGLTIFLKWGWTYTL